MPRNDYFSRMESKKEPLHSPFPPTIIYQFFCTLSRKTPNYHAKLIYKHENSGRFPCLYHIPRFSTAFSVKQIPFSAKTTNILPLFTFPFYTITETPDFCVKVYFCLIVRFLPQSPSYQRHPKTRKSGVHHPPWWTPPSLKTLDFKPFFNTFACKYPKSYGIIFLLPPVPLLKFDDFYPTYAEFTPPLFAIRQIDKLHFHRTNAILPGTARLPLP